jgi:hypothetical protein
MSIQSNGSYETLGKVAFGQAGWIAVLMSKFLYPFGCLIAYIVIIKDNMNVAVLHLLYGNHPSDTSWFVHLLKREDVVTLLLMQHSSHFALVLPSRHVVVDKPYFRRQCRRNRIHCNHYHLSIH